MTLVVFIALFTIVLIFMEILWEKPAYFTMQTFIKDICGRCSVVGTISFYKMSVLSIYANNELELYRF